MVNKQIEKILPKIIEKRREERIREKSDRRREQSLFI